METPVQSGRGHRRTHSTTKATVISPLDSVRKQRRWTEIEANFREDEGHLEALYCTLEECHKLSSSVDSTLQQIQRRWHAVEGAMKPIQQYTATSEALHTSLERAISSVHSRVEKLRDAREIADSMLSDDYVHLTKVDTCLELMEYFREDDHSRYKSVPVVVEKMSRALRTAQSVLLEEFTHLCSNKGASSLLEKSKPALDAEKLGSLLQRLVRIRAVDEGFSGALKLEQPYFKVWTKMRIECLLGVLRRAMQGVADCEFDMKVLETLEEEERWNAGLFASLQEGKLDSTVDSVRDELYVAVVTPMLEEYWSRGSVGKLAVSRTGDSHNMQCSTSSRNVGALWTREVEKCLDRDSEGLRILRELHSTLLRLEHWDAHSQRWSYVLIMSSLRRRWSKETTDLKQKVNRLVTDVAHSVSNWPMTDTIPQERATDGVESLAIHHVTHYTVLAVSLLAPFQEPRKPSTGAPESRAPMVSSVRPILDAHDHWLNGLSSSFAGTFFAALSSSPGNSIIQTVAPATGSSVANTGAQSHAALSAAFRINQLHYLSSQLVEPVLEKYGVCDKSWTRDHSARLEKEKKLYTHSVWGNAIEVVSSTFQVPQIGAKISDKVKKDLKQRFSKINAVVEGILWTTSPIIEEELRLRLWHVAKEAFLTRYEQWYVTAAEIPFTKNPSKYIRHTPEDLTTKVMRFYRIPSNKSA